MQVRALQRERPRCVDAHERAGGLSAQPVPHREQPPPPLLLQGIPQKRDAFHEDGQFPPGSSVDSGPQIDRIKASQRDRYAAEAH